ncbi:hypothetical protein NUU61_001790 [Penicillium alfredii]|uniref:Uncharacterized protein n=1 Tax=Penicillium alfredii TaxID=1506179 RepID=A0A9W9KG64_9EURO|nr:uncharacterized protein NUU61_001790 [Penicillium alfredii]KAJ5104443.1 hypothetical protein NUU61_001790 [Penicillium alfredii]
MTNPDLLKQEREWREIEKRERVEAAKEALNCSKCRLAVTEETMALEIESGNFILTQYPPCFANTNKRDEHISPLDTVDDQEDFTYWKHLSRATQQQYHDRVEEHLDKALAKLDKFNPELVALFAHYQVAYHIRQHYLARGGVLVLCRSSDDVHQLRRWQWEMAHADGTLSADTGDKVMEEDEVPWVVDCERWQWPHDANLLMMHQSALWRRRWRRRQRRVEEVRVRWALIMEERWRQREMLQLKQASTLTVRLYCRGELWDVRELERSPDLEVVSWTGRMTRSTGF